MQVSAFAMAVASGLLFAFVCAATARHSSAFGRPVTLTLIRMMKRLLPALTIWAAFAAHAQALPDEVARFLSERKICEHFLGEPVEGRTPEERARRDFVADGIDIYCSGTDKRLAALKRRYAKDASARAVLNALEAKLE